MQYFKPAAPHLFVGDCMPFYHDGCFHIYYLQDEGHHQALGGLGGHQWAHAATTDLVHWTHHPLALALTEDEERSICTGSVFWHDGTYYAFHAVRRPDWTQRLGVATSADGVTFTKLPVPPHAEPAPGYDPRHYRDPMVFQEPDSGRFHMLVTAHYTDYAVPPLGNCLAHLVSPDLTTWTLQEPFMVPGFLDAPECPDYFEWNGFYYLVFSNRLQARYRVARAPLGPWQTPAVDVLDGPWGRVMKTAAYHDNRRLGAAWLGTRVDNQDAGRLQWGGHLFFRELVQASDGTLSTRFVPELALPVGAPLPLTPAPLTAGAAVTPGRVALEAGTGMAVAGLSGVPHNAQITATVRPQSGVQRLGLRLRESTPFSGGYAVEVRPAEHRVELFDAVLSPVAGLDEPFTLEIILKDDIIDLCLDNRHCLINRCPEQQGDGLSLFCHNGAVVFEQLEIRPLV
jgi:beta-fructofuranosidase